MPVNIFYVWSISEPDIDGPPSGKKLRRRRARRQDSGCSRTTPGGRSDHVREERACSKADQNAGREFELRGSMAPERTRRAGHRDRGRIRASGDTTRSPPGHTQKFTLARTMSGLPLTGDVATIQPLFAFGQQTAFVFASAVQGVTISKRIVPRLVCLMETMKGGSRHENSDYRDR